MLYNSIVGHYDNHNDVIHWIIPSHVISRSCDACYAS